jgi:hypothetical protein
MQTNLVKIDKLTNDELNFIEDELMQEDDSLVLVIETDNSNKAHFIYRVYEDLGFHFSLLSEVGECYKQAYIDLLNEYNLQLQTVETANDYFNIAVPIA